MRQLAAISGICLAGLVLMAKDVGFVEALTITGGLCVAYLLWGHKLEG